MISAFGAICLLKSGNMEIWNGNMETNGPYRDVVSAPAIQCIIRVHQTLGPGFPESVYRRALVRELRKQHLKAQTEYRVTIYYDGIRVGRHYLDLLVEDQLIIELKTVEALHKAHYAQVRSYLKATGLPLALLVNFAGEKADFRRIEAV